MLNDPLGLMPTNNDPLGLMTSSNDPLGLMPSSGDPLGLLPAEKPPGLYEGLIKPTAKAIGKVGGTAALQLGGMIPAGLTGLGVGIAAQVDRFRGRDVDPILEANRAYEATMARGNLVTTPEEQKSLENIMLVMKPIEWAGKGAGAIGAATGIPYAEPILGTAAEFGAMSLMGLRRGAKTATTADLLRDRTALEVQEQAGAEAEVRRQAASEAAVRATYNLRRNRVAPLAMSEEELRAGQEYGKTETEIRQAMSLARQAEIPLPGALGRRRVSPVPFSEESLRAGEEAGRAETEVSQAASLERQAAMPLAEPYERHRPAPYPFKVGEVAPADPLGLLDERGSFSFKKKKDALGADVKPIPLFEQPQFRKEAEAQLDKIDKTFTKAELEVRRQAPSFTAKLSDLKNRLFTPEAVSVDSRIVDSKLAGMITGNERAKQILWKKYENRYYWWEKIPQNDQLQFMIERERGRFATGTPLGKLSRDYQQRMDACKQRELKAGIEYDALDAYVYHATDNPSAARAYIRKYAESLGKAGFVEHREMRFLDQLLKYAKDEKGNPIRLKTYNPEMNALLREFASDLAITRKQFMDDLMKTGMAKDYKEAKESPEGMIAIDDPLGKRYWVAKDLKSLLDNSLFSKSMWTSEGIGGDLFRGLMAVKNTWVPIKLALSGFHAIHVATMLGPALRVPIYQNILRGNMGWYEGITELAKTVSPIQSRMVVQGVRLNKLWDHPEGASPADAQAIQYLIEGGMKPKLDAVWKADAIRSFREAVAKGEYPSSAIHGMRSLIQAMQWPLFEVYIPAIKTQAFLHETQGLLKRNPNLVTDATARGMELRKIAKSTDNRFGELNYSTLFWDKMLKEVGIGSSLSMGWNLGFVREYGGAFFDAAKATRNLVKGKGTINDITSKMLFTADYTLNTAIICGLTSWALTKQMPKLLDCFYPRTGFQNPDGTEERLNTPFYAKEFFSLASNWERKGLIHGTFSYGANKLNPLLTTAGRLWENKDFYGYEIYDETKGQGKQLVETLNYLIGETAPISVSGVRQAEKVGSPVTGKTSWLGFGPAPSHIVKSSLNTEISDLYQKHVAHGRVLSEKAASDEKQKIRQEYRKGNTEEANKLFDAAIAKGTIKEQYAATFVKEADLPSDVILFRMLPASDQEYLLSKMSLPDLVRYTYYSKLDVWDKVAGLSKDGKRYANLYAQGKAQQPKWVRGKLVNGIGDMTNEEASGAE